jgi:hypothetical protein
LGADYFVDKSEEFEKLGEILSSLFPDSLLPGALSNSSVLV